MTACLTRQRHPQLTNQFGTSEGMGLSAADLADICTQARLCRGNQLRQKGTSCSRLHARRAHMNWMGVVTGNFKSP